MGETIEAEIVAVASTGESSQLEPSPVSGAGDGEFASDFDPGARLSCLEEMASNAAGGEAEETARSVVGGGQGIKRMYSRMEIEVLRFVGVPEQRRWWKRVYEGLGEVVAREYDGLLAENPPKKKKKLWGKKKESAPVADEGFSMTHAKILETLDFSRLVSDEANVGNDNIQAVEELCCDYGSSHVDDSSEDEYDSIRKPAFLVEGEPDFDSGEPHDGLEYLRRVRWEAAQFPKVKVAKIKSSKSCSEQTPYMPKIPEIAKCPANLVPSKLWEDAFLADFSHIRKKFSQLENSCNQPSTDNGSDSCSENSFEDLDCRMKARSIPTLTVIRSMDAVSRAAMLRNCISMFESASALSRDKCLWLFALSVVVDTPLNADTCASLRCLLRKCSGLLARKSEADDEVAMLNILITITGKYFGQSENY